MTPKELKAIQINKIMDQLKGGYTAESFAYNHVRAHLEKSPLEFISALYVMLLARNKED